MYPVQPGVLDALQARGADAHALQEAADEAERAARSTPGRPDQRPHRHRDGAHRGLRRRLRHQERRPRRIPDRRRRDGPDPALPGRPAPRARHRACTATTSIVAVADPSDVVALDDIRAATGMTVVPVVAARSELRKLIDRLKREESDLADVASALKPDESNDFSRLGIGRRRRADRALRQLPHRAGDSEPRLRPAPRADRARPAGPVPHRRRAARDRPRAHRRPVAADLAAEDHGRRRHHRAPGAAERPHHGAARRAQGRPAARDAADGVGREGRAAGSRHRRHRPRTEEARLRRRHLRALLEVVLASRTAWCWSPDRPARASRRRCTRRWPRSASPRSTSSPSRTRSSTASPASTRCRSTTRPA